MAVRFNKLRIRNTFSYVNVYYAATLLELQGVTGVEENAYGLTGVEGSEVVYVYQSGAWHGVSDVVGPQGEQGIQGEQGEQGDTGPQGAQNALDTTPNITPQRQAQNEIDNWPIALKALALTLLDQINMLRTRAGLPTVSSTQALAAIRDKAGTL